MKQEQSGCTLLHTKVYKKGSSKAMRNNLLITLSAFFGALFGAVVALRFTERLAPQPKSRTLEEIAPTYKVLSEKYAGDDELFEDHQKAWIRFVREAVKPNLTELEADQVGQAILEYMPPAYNWFEPLFPSEEKEEGDNVP
jgi:hypothetical protein